eukprot:8535560-Heterocapsa_arctica.AAC.1
MKNLNGGKPFVEEERGRDPKRGPVGGDGAAAGRRPDGLPDGDGLHTSAGRRPRGLHRKCARARSRGS